MVTVIALSAWVNTAVAGNLADEAELNFQLAAKAYQAGDYERALFYFMASNRLSPNRNVAFNVGRSYEALGRYPQAYRWYRDALAAFREAGADAAAVVASIERLKPRVAVLSVTSDPPGATVYVDRVELGSVGETPLEIAMPPGSPKLIVTRDGHETVTTEPIPLEAVGTQRAVNVALKAIVGRLVVQGIEGTSVHLGNENADPLCVVPCDVPIAAGTQILYFKQDGYRTTPGIAEVLEGQTVTLAAEMPAIKGTVVVDADAQGALIEIDDKPVGYTPAVLSDVRVGAHVVRVSMRGFVPFEAEIEVREDQTVDLGRIALDPIFTVSAASRQAQDVAEAPASVTLIPVEEIRAFGYQSVYEAVAGVRGLYQTNDLTYQSLGFRGFGRTGDYGNRVLVTLDGHTMNDDQIGSSYIGSDFLSDLGDVKQIEVVRGPGSALYGSNAVFGVVNVVTRDREDPHEAHVTVTGAEQSVRARVGAGVGDEEAGAWVSVAGLYGPGREYVFEEYADRPSGGVSRGADETTARTVLMKAWTGDFTLQGAYYSREKEIPTGAFGSNLGDFRAASNDGRGFLEARYEGGTEATRVTARAYLDHYRFFGLYPYGPGVFQDRYNGTWAGVEPRLDQQLGEIGTLTIGAETRQFFISNMRSDELDGVDGQVLGTPLDETPTFQIYSAYSVLDLGFGKDLRLNLGGRADAYQTAVDDFVTFNPRAAVLITPGKEVVKLMGGTAFRAPSPYEYFYNDGGISTIAPDTLDPETIATAEAEWTHAFSQVLSTTVSGFYNTIDALIDTEEVGDVFRFANVDARVQTAGGEFELRRAWRSRWMVAAQTSVQQTRIGSLTDGDSFENSPAVLGALMGAVPLGPNVTMAHKVRGESPRLTRRGDRTPWACLWDVTVTGDVPALGVRYGLGVRNLLDWPIDHPGGPDLQQDVLRQLGRQFFATTTVNF